MKRYTPKVLVGDCLAVMRTLPSNYVHSIVSDPPYGLMFMDSLWDFEVPGPDYWREALRVARPGAHAAVFGGTRTAHRLTVALEDAGWQIRDVCMWLYATGFPKGIALGNSLPAWEGYSTCLKPAYEPIIIARKPIAGHSITSNVEEYGTGALNIDGCRIPTSDVYSVPAPDTTVRSPAHAGVSSPVTYRRPGLQQESHAIGRWPANVVMDEEVAYCAGDVSRYFYCPKASRSERDAGVTLPPQQQDTTRSALQPSMNGGDGNPFNRGVVPRANNHPCVKPIALMRWITRLVTPPAGIVLDPFAGSGTTGIAARAEGFKAICIERDEHFASIASERIRHHARSK